MRELTRAGFREVHAVGNAQAPYLSVERRTGGRELALLVDEAFPDFDKAHIRAGRTLAQDFVQVLHIRIRASALSGGMPTT